MGIGEKPVEVGDAWEFPIVGGKRKREDAPKAEVLVGSLKKQKPEPVKETPVKVKDTPAKTPAKKDTPTPKVIVATTSKSKKEEKDESSSGEEDS